MKKRFVLAMAILTLSLYAFSEVKIGIINAQAVVENTKKGQRIQVELEALGKAKQAEMKKMQDELTLLEKEIASPALNAETRDKKTRQVQDKRINLQRYLEDAQKEVQAKTQSELMNFQKEIMPLIQEIGKAQGFSVIFDVTSAGIAYFDNTLDITSLVVKAVDAKTK